MASDWEEVMLGDYVDHQKGYIFKSKDYQDEGEIIVRVSDFTNRSIDISSCNRIDKLRVDEFQSVKLNTHDVIIATVGSWPKNPASIVGKTVSVPKEAEGALLNQNAVRLRAINGVEQRFLFSLLKNKAFQNYIVSTAQGSANQASITLRDIFRYSFKLPPLTEQKTIAHILGSLDDKIELNRQMNETLEAMAQALFKSWFVDFDPVIDNALAAGNAIPDEFAERAEQRKGIEKKDNSDIQRLFPNAFEFTEEMGWIPKGWSVTSLENVCSKITDGSHSSPKSVDEGYPMASVKDMHNWGFDLNTCRKISEEDYHELRRNNCNPLKNDVLIAKDGSYLKHIFVVEEDLDLVVLSSIAMLRPNKNINPHFLSLTLKRKDVLRMMENYVSGAVLQRIVLRDFRKFLIVNPPIDIQIYWFKLVEGMFEASWNNIHSNNSLAKLRDTLLPKLMSGELRIPDAAALVDEVF